MKNNRLDELEKRIEALEGIRADIKKDIKFTRIGNLEWSEDLGEMKWYDAKKACEKAGGRLPTRLELLDLFDNHRDACEELIEDSPSNFFWSATEVSGTNAWYVYLSCGYTSTNNKTTANRVRCVRGCKEL